MDITLSNYEMKLINDQEVLLTKNKIIQKVYELFGDLAQDYKGHFSATSLAVENETDAKISRGENYKGLPYVVLDYPRRFAKVDVFAIRSFFWWGNFFSITLQLAGAYQLDHAKSIQKAIDTGMLTGWFTACSATAWEHDFGNGNYQLIQQGKNYDLSHTPFIKIAKKIPLTQWDQVDTFLKENFTFLVEVLGS